ncbi:SAM-dependent methyltransferase [Phormidium tenue]|uniref:Methyltransferase n=1 Tax=Phormidium tenue NIES-30 TaxID=549789 RepID=A0A1U7IYW7_9CYAN|nr:SAM-dependent methyltransferase [Phormidium tenue]MBD2234700.1 methyltransferase domain-containing protein [Phormidium tenue FACHB-1052]OKH43979.1 methyltransferase [Phormidium tenue NIES-30]
MTEQSLAADFFDTLYQADPDPWRFETSDYEAAKYAATLAALPKPRYRSAFEIGGSIGVLTEQLAPRCDGLLSVDLSALAQERAIQRCQHLSQVRFQLMNVPQDYPDESFDLVLLSEVGYYWCQADLCRAQQLIYESLEPSGQLLLVHWLHEAPSYPLRGDDVHNAFQAFAAIAPLNHLYSHRTADYRLDLYERP